MALIPLPACLLTALAREYDSLSSAFLAHARTSSLAHLFSEATSTHCSGDLRALIARRRCAKAHLFLTAVQTGWHTDPASLLRVRTTVRASLPMIPFHL